MFKQNIKCQWNSCRGYNIYIRILIKSENSFHKINVFKVNTY